MQYLDAMYVADGVLMRTDQTMTACELWLRASTIREARGEPASMAGEGLPDGANMSHAALAAWQWAARLKVVHARRLAGLKANCVRVRFVYASSAVSIALRPNT